MGLEHFFTREFTVRLGGRAIGPLFLGGRRYSVGPLSALRYMELRSGLARALGFLWNGKELERLGDLLTKLPPETFRPLALLVVEERIRPADLERLTPAQFASAWEALAAANDFPYIERRLYGGDGPSTPEGPELGLGHMALGAVRACSGHYSPRQVLTGIPIQEFLSILDAEADIKRAVDPDDAGKIHDSDLDYFREHYPEYFDEADE